MAIIEPPDHGLRPLRGLHLYHFAMSNCSQRIRVMLAEKKLDWTSHHVNLAKDEQVTPAFLRVNPRGQVPVLIHDGVVHVESNDILRYLEERFPEPSLSRGDPDRILRWQDRSDALQHAVKVTSHEFLFKPAARKSRRQLARFRVLHADNPALLAFHEAFSSPQGLPEALLRESVSQLHDAVREMDAALAGSTWLAGEHFSLADIAWMVNAHRLELMRFPTDDYPNYRRWLRAVSSRDAYRKGLQDWENGYLLGFFGLYSRFRRLIGDDVRAWMQAGATA